MSSWCHNDDEQFLWLIMWHPFLIKQLQRTHSITFWRVPRVKNNYTKHNTRLSKTDTVAFNDFLHDPEVATRSDRNVQLSSNNALPQQCLHQLLANCKHKHKHQPSHLHTHVTAAAGKGCVSMSVLFQGTYTIHLLTNETAVPGKGNQRLAVPLPVERIPCVGSWQVHVRSLPKHQQCLLPETLEPPTFQSTSMHAHGRGSRHQFELLLGTAAVTAASGRHVIAFNNS